MDGQMEGGRREGGREGGREEYGGLGFRFRV
jgi:hypothetical protein